ncbi:MAG: G5 domain-containing protein [Chloroflexota bacterium]|nr:G5 domain-containing protein [Chloroflexota bacterium]
MNRLADTQPLSAAGGDTRPHLPEARRRRAAKRVRWLLLIIILAASCSLPFTGALFLRALQQSLGANIGGIQVGIESAGALRTVETRLGTVGELLSELALQPPQNGALSHSASDPLVDGMVIRLLPPRAVHILVNNDERVVQTALENPWQILERANIALAATDKIWVNGALANLEALPAWTIPARRIRIRRAARLTIIDDGETSTILTNADTLGDALRDAGITLHIADQATPALDSAPVSDMTVRIKRALPIKLRLDGVTIDARTNAALVGDVLLELNAPLFGLDAVLPPADTAVSENMVIEILRVTEDIVTERAAIDFAVRTQLDADLNLDDVAVVQDGRAGLQETRYRLRYENGVEVSRELLETAVVEAPVDKIIAYGARIAQQVVDTPAGPRHYWRRLCVYATSYKPESNGGNRRTATGATLAKGIVAAKPHIIPYYTEVFVPNYGLGVVRDTGAGPRSTPYWIDLGYSDHDWVTWGGYTWVYLLSPPPAEINYDLPPWAPVRNRPQGCAA